MAVSGRMGGGAMATEEEKSSVEGKAGGRREDVGRAEKRSQAERRGDDRRQNDRRLGLDRRRGPGRRRGEIRKSAEEGEMSGEMLEFIMTIDEYKRINERPFPTNSEIYEIMKYLGYRRVAERAEHINKPEGDSEPSSS